MTCGVLDQPAMGPHGSEKPDTFRTGGELFLPRVPLAGPLSLPLFSNNKSAGVKDGGALQTKCCEVGLGSTQRSALRWGTEAAVMTVKPSRCQRGDLGGGLKPGCVLCAQEFGNVQLRRRGGNTPGPGSQLGPGLRERLPE